MENILRCPACKAEVTTYKNPLPTADVVAIRDGKILLILRRNPPAGWALPGGFIEYGESAEQAAIRELKEETGLDATALRLAGVFSEPGRDSRFHTVTIVYRADISGELRAGDDATDARWFPLDELPDTIAFDHRKVIAEATKT